MKLKTFFLMILIFAGFFIYADGVSPGEIEFLSDSMGNVYSVKKSGKITGVFKASPKGTAKYF